MIVFMLFAFLVVFETQKGQKRHASSPSANGLFGCFCLVPLPILEILLAAFTPPE
jgi:hypothetical protein